MISIIVPVLNEEKTIIKTITNLISLKGEKEILVIDGGSTDKTVSLAKTLVKVIETSKGRSLQMNAGAKDAKGNILWFVHSDSIIDKKSLSNIEKTISKGYIGGGFSLYFYDTKNIFMKFIAITSNLRGAFGKIFFGDQGIFIKKESFISIDGFPKISIMEDFEFSLKIKKIGKMKLLKSKIGTSSRRFTKGGIFKTFLLMQKMKLLYLAGVSPDKLDKMYREVR